MKTSVMSTLVALIALVATSACTHITSPGPTPAGQQSQVTTSQSTGVGGGPVEAGEHQSPPTMSILEARVHPQLNGNSQRCNAMEEREDWSEAANCYAELAQDNASSELVDVWLIKSASNFERHGESAKAQIVRLFLIQHRPHSDYAADIIIIIADDFRDHHATDKALPFYATYLQAFPDGPHHLYVKEQCDALGGCTEYDWEPM